jgi:transcriptional regulator with GAF, ATPase, and Fis domain
MNAEDFPLQSGTKRPALAGELWTLDQVAEHLPRQLNLRDTLADLERLLIERALRAADGVQAEAARCLELSRSDIGYKLGKYGRAGAPRSDATNLGSP